MGNNFSSFQGSAGEEWRQCMSGTEYWAPSGNPLLPTGRSALLGGEWKYLEALADSGIPVPGTQGQLWQTGRGHLERLFSGRLRPPSLKLSPGGFFSPKRLPEKGGALQPAVAPECCPRQVRVGNPQGRLVLDTLPAGEPQFHLCSQARAANHGENPTEQPHK